MLLIHVALRYNVHMSHKLRIGVLRGGPSNEYDVSLQTGANILGVLRTHFDDRYTPRDVFIDKSGAWHIDGLSVSPSDLRTKIDVAVNALHGSYGEDGKVQYILESHGIPFTGSGSLASAVGMNKILSKNVFKNHDIKTPMWREYSSDRIGADTPGIVKELFNSFILPGVVKPVASGSSVGVTIVHKYSDLGAAFATAAEHGDTVMIEEYIPGVEATAGVIEGFRGQELYALPPIEIRPMTAFFDYEAKYAGKSQEIVPATFSDKIKRELEDLAVRIHRALGLRHYSRSDFMIHPRRGIYVLEVNTLPGLTNESLMPKALRAVGSDTHEFVEHLIQLAQRNQ